MEDIRGSIEDIINLTISGFHQYRINRLTEPVLCYVSESFLTMLGIGKTELKEETASGTDILDYTALVHPEDRTAYLAFLMDFMDEGAGKTGTLQYRMLRKDGSLLYVSDTMTALGAAADEVTLNSVLTDITALKTETGALQFLNETIPCGFMKYTCEKQPRITYINEKMMEILRFPENPAERQDYLDRYRENLYLMIPMEEWKRFGLYLNRVNQQGSPVAGEITILRCDGTRAHLFGWVTKHTGAGGAEEFQSVCMDITEKYQRRMDAEARRYLKALTEVYDLIFAFNLSENVVKCISAPHSEAFKKIEGVPLQMREATEKWIRDTVFPEDQERMLAFFRDFYQRKNTEKEDLPPRIDYRALNAARELCSYSGIFLKTDSTMSLFCCRAASFAEEARLLRSENASLKNLNENMQELVLRFTDGIAAFELNGNYVTPLYTSGNVCQFFGVSREEWAALLKKKTLLRSFVQRSHVPYSRFAELLRSGEAEFVYQDQESGTERRIKAICSQMSAEGDAPRYVMLYNIDSDTHISAYPADEAETPGGAAAEKSALHERHVVLHTFGYFDVFVEGRPIAFRSEKSKELFALLTDRRGGFVSSEEAIGYLWPEEPSSSVTLARYRKVALRLKNILEEYGIPEVVESVDGKRRIVPERVECDLYQYLSGKKEYAQLFKGSYLSNYSWGEMTLGELSGFEN